MSHHQSIRIPWRTLNGETYRYGSLIQLRDNETYFSNPLMPSGLQIHKWRMGTRFDKDKHAPSLPLLQRGGRYRIEFQVEATPVDSVYFVMIFYSKSGHELRRWVIQQKQYDFEYPTDAYRYDICMMNAACQSLRFKCICLTEDSATHQLKDDVYSDKELQLVPHHEDYVRRVNQLIQRTRHSYGHV